MRRLSLLVLALSPLASAPLAADSPDRGDTRQRLGYSIGYRVGDDFRRLGLPIDPELVVRGVVDALAGSESLMTPDEMRQTLADLKRRSDAAEQRAIDATEP